ncbi:MAG: motility associated factor glycosyltransferase family protein [Treponema sp.]|nr:motility associated factor glycosyltransferase family protein [Treponema sp.]
MIYSSSVKSRDGDDIPLFLNQHPAHSKYNPGLQAENFVKNLKQGFTVIGGIAGGFHIKEAVNKFPESFFICVEADLQSLEFCRNLKINCELEKKQNVVFTSKENLEEKILSLYNPSFYDDFLLEFESIWKNENSNEAQEIYKITQNALKKIKADYSVQAHFGKLWNHNIFMNADFFEEIQVKKLPDFPVEKTCCIISAGPTLEKDFQLFKEKKDSLFLISCDTSYQALLQNGIYPDAVVSTDSQYVSSEHFYSAHDSSIKKTIFVFDISSPASAVRAVLKKGHDVFFVKSGHPLSSFLFPDDALTFLNASGGTVTLSASDFAVKAGFTKLMFPGADFAYSGGKPYVRGTYLEKKFYSVQNRFSNAETLYSSIMFRTPLEKVKDDFSYTELMNFPVTTEVLCTYKQSLGEFIEKNYFKREGNVFVTAKKIRKINEGVFSKARDLKEMLLKNPVKEKQVFLPFIAWLKNRFRKKSFDELCSIAYSMSRRYN